MHKTQVQMDERFLHKTSHIELNLIEKKAASSPQCMGTGDNFLNITPVAQILRAGINKWDLLKLRSFCKSKGHGQQDKKAAYRMGKIFTNLKSDRRLISKLYKELKKLDIKRTNDSTNKIGYRPKQRTLNRGISNG